MKVSKLFSKSRSCLLPRWALVLCSALLGFPALSEDMSQLNHQVPLLSGNKPDFQSHIPNDGRQTQTRGLATIQSDLSSSAGYLAQDLFADGSATTWLAVAGLVVLSGRFDQTIDDAVKANRTDSALQTAKSLDYIPLLVGAGAGVLAMGVSDDEMSRTGYTAIKAAGFTLVSNLVLKTTLGRARPLDEQGDYRFAGLTNTSPQSSLASNHVATTFALVTPFAQQYQQPWLYGLGVLSAIGRIEQREHWFSDTVAGGLLGYAIGSSLHAHQKKGPELILSARRLEARWEY
jgi:hypothetical protein